MRSAGVVLALVAFATAAGAQRSVPPAAPLGLRIAPDDPSRGVAVDTPPASASGQVTAAGTTAAARCPATFRQAVAAGDGGPVPRACWQLGPLHLGMTRADVEQRIGVPVARLARPAQDRRFAASLYAFSARPGTPLVDAGSFRLVELRYAGERLVAIDNEPGARITDTSCGEGLHRAAAIETDAPAGPLLGFNQVQVGDPLRRIRARFGRAPAANRSRDWFSYLPVPISFGSDPDRGIVTGIAIASSADALTTAARPELRLERDTVSCRLTAIYFALR